MIPHNKHLAFDLVCSCFKQRHEISSKRWKVNLVLLIEFENYLMKLKAKANI